MFIINNVYATSEQKKVEFHQLTDDLYMVVYDWPSRIILSVGKEGGLLVDANVKLNFPIVYSAIAKKFDNIPIKYVISTHSHKDHTGGNPFLINKGAISIAHENTKSVMHELYYTDEEGNEIDDPAKGKPIRDYQTNELPQITFSERMNIDFNGDSIELIHRPNAHTDGDLIVYFKKNNVIALGDNYFGNAYTFGQNFDGMINVYQTTVEMIDDKTIIVPGHGVQSNKKELSQYLAMIKDVKSIILQKISAGKTLEQVASDSSITKRYDEKYGQLLITGEEFRKRLYSFYSEKINIGLKSSDNS